MGNFNCCNCIEKKETQINQLSNLRKTSNEPIQKRINLIKTIEFSKFIKDNKDIYYEEKSSFISSDEEDKNATKRTNKTNNKFNENSQSFSFLKDISLKNIKNNGNYQHGNINQDINNKNKYINNINNINDIDEKIEMKENKSIGKDYKLYNTDHKKSKFNIYMKSLEDKVREENYNKGMILNHSNNFPLKYNYQKNKYISYFSE